MPRELVTIQVGQCGNQVAMRFWDLALQEHARYNKTGIFDDSLSSFFRNLDTRYSDPLDLGVGSPIGTLKARAVVIDMEEGVLNSMLRSDLGEIFDQRQFISDVSGCGNNWAVGFHDYGPRYREEILDKVRRSVEQCDSIQSFFLLHSMGGGTGSGLGTFILEQLSMEFEDIFRFSTVVFPEDDVVTGPYNSLLALKKLKDFSDCVLPVDNRALMDILSKIESSKRKGVKQDIAEDGNGKRKAFDKMNNIIAHMLNNLTCSMRFDGQLNVDLNEITMNLVPFPGMPFLVSSISPLYSVLDVKLEPRRLDQIFTDVISRDFQLLKVDPKNGTYMACGLILRGKATISDLNRNVNRIKNEMRMIHWNTEGFKVGLCSQEPVGMPYSLLCLANNSSIKNYFEDFKSHVLKIYRRKAHVHHYTQYMEQHFFDDSLSTLDDLIGSYSSLEGPGVSATRQRVKPLMQQLMEEQFVVPGDIIQCPPDSLSGLGTIKTGDDQIVATVMGKVQVINSLIIVTPMQSRYKGEIGNVVVGRVAAVGNLKWRVDVGSTQQAVLHISGANTLTGEIKIKSDADQLTIREIFNQGELLSSDVQMVKQENKEITLNMRSKQSGKLRNGFLVKLGPQVVPKLRTHFHKLSNGVDLIIGENGWMWVYVNQNEEITVGLVQRQEMVRVGNVLKLLAKAGVKVSIDNIELGLQVFQGWRLDDMLTHEAVNSLKDALMLQIILIQIVIPNTQNIHYEIIKDSQKPRVLTPISLAAGNKLGVNSCYLYCNSISFRITAFTLPVFLVDGPTYIY